MPLLVRKAVKDDLLTVAKMYKKGLIELGETEIIDDKVMNKVINSYHLAPCFLLEIDGKICGMAGLTAVSPVWNNTVSLADYMFFIEKEHRGLDNLGALVSACKDFAKEMKLPLRLEFISGSEKARKRLFAMNGINDVIMLGVYRG